MRDRYNTFIERFKEPGSWPSSRAKPVRDRRDVFEATRVEAVVMPTQSGP
jgi:hypothetical protein